MEKPRYIFLIDDDLDDIGLFMKSVSTIAPYISCDFALDCPEAMEKLTKAVLLPDLIFLDLNIPPDGGKACLAELKKHRLLKDIPVIIYTTSSSETEKEETIKLGAYYFITKPSSFYDLIKMIAIISKGELPKNSFT